VNNPTFQEALAFFNGVMQESDLSTEKIWLRGGQSRLAKSGRLQISFELEKTHERDIQMLYEKHNPGDGEYFVFYVVGTLKGRTLCTLLGDQFTLDDEDDLEKSDKIRPDWKLIFCASESWGEAEVIESKIKWLALSKLAPSQLSNLDYMFV
jgi:hypothetical protein